MSAGMMENENKLIGIRSEIEDNEALRIYDCVCDSGGWLGGWMHCIARFYGVQ